VLWFYIVNLAAVVTAIMVNERGYRRLSWGIAATSLAVVVVGLGLQNGFIPRGFRLIWLVAAGLAAYLFVIGLGVLADAWRREAAFEDAEDAEDAEDDVATP